MAHLDMDSLGQGPTVRAWRPGDRFQPLGMSGTKKVSDVLAEAGVPRAWRSQVPLVVSPRGVAWIVGGRIAHWARVTPETQQVVELRFIRTGGAENFSSS